MSKEKQKSQKKKARILAIETSCDETAAAMIEMGRGVSLKKPSQQAERAWLEKRSDERARPSVSAISTQGKLIAGFCETAEPQIKVLSNVVSSQIKIHQKYGGVYPELASREHIRNILPVISQTLVACRMSLDSIDVISVTTGPGLIGSLLVGVETAKSLAYALKKPIIGVDHLEGHTYASLAGEAKIDFPAIALIVSGGHTSLIYMKKHLDYKILGQTLDDACGEAFDKVSQLLELGYPGGPAIEAEASKFQMTNDPHQRSTQLQIRFPISDTDGLNFSYSGLKTAVLYHVKSHKSYAISDKRAIAQAFQEAAIAQLVNKTKQAVQTYRPKTLIVGGGVAANSYLREQINHMLKANSYKLNLLIPPANLCTDNAVGIGIAAAFRILSKLKDNWYDVIANANQKL